MQICFLHKRGALFLAGKWLGKAAKRAPNMPLGAGSRHHKGSATEENNAPRLGQEAFSCKIMKINLRLFILERSKIHLRGKYSKNLFILLHTTNCRLFIELVFGEDALYGSLK